MERARAYAAWQAQYAAQQYQYAMWQAQQPREPARRWYGWQTLVSDGAAIACVLGGAAASEGRGHSNDTAAGALYVTSFLTYTFVPPIIHLAHGHGGKAAGSIGLRLGAMLLTVAGVAACYGNNDAQCALLFVGMLGFPASIVLDAALIAREDVAPDEEAKVRFTPWITRTQGGVAAGLGGAF